MNVQVRLEPLGRTLEVPVGTNLADVLFPYGVEFPCGGRGRCRRCRIRLLDGTLTGPDAQEPDGSWLACHCRIDSNAVIEIAQWDTPILADASPFEFTPRPGYGVAVDIGTTTLVAQLVDLRTAHVLAVRTALNPQTRHGADLMTRIDFALHGGAAELAHLVRAEVARMIAGLNAPEPPARIRLAGNTAMHHLYCGLDVTPLSHYPFETTQDGWFDLDPATRFLPCLGGFVGSDLLAGILATRMHLEPELTVLLDLGTNGEVVAGNRDGLLCCSTAAGPAFEGGRIGMGMRAATGAIAEVHAEDGNLACRVLGGGSARGICGSGLVDAVAAALDLGLVRPNGRITTESRQIELAPPVVLTQSDIRELQLAKGATAAGVDILLRRLGARPDDVARVYLAGAFGNTLNRTAAARIGLLAFPEDKVLPVGNTSLLGAKLALFTDDNFDTLRAQTRHIPLGHGQEFEDAYIENMALEKIFAKY